MPARRPDHQENNDNVSLQARVKQFEQQVVEEIHVRDTESARKQVRRARFDELKFIGAWCGLWAMLTATALLAHAAWSSDETRLLGIAWEMWSHQQFIVPSLNGEAQLHPPLFFWLVHAGWFAFGATESWARLVGPLGALASLFVVQRLARLLWPPEREAVRYAPLLLLGMFAFALMGSATLPDAWMLFGVLLSFWGLLIGWRRRDMRAWMLLGLGLAVGALAGGFIVFVYVLPVAAIAPLWARSPRPQWKYWYVDLFKTLALAVGIVSLWLAAAGANEGAPYVVRFLAHAWEGTPLALFTRAHSWWWYAALVPFVFLPWSAMPLAWMRLWHIRREPLEDGFVFCLAWAVLPLLVLSVLPVKQAPLLVPLLPAGALLAARLLFGRELLKVYEDNALAGMAFPLLLFGGAQITLHALGSRVEFLPAWLSQQPAWIGWAIMGVGVASAWVPLKDVHRRVFDIAGVCVALVATVLVVVAAQFNRLYPIDEVGQVLAQAQARGQPIAYIGTHVGDYRGEFHFAARLAAPLALITPAHAEAWAAEHPNGVLITYVETWQPRFASRMHALFDAPFQDGWLRVFSAAQMRSDKETVSGLTLGGTP